MYLCVQSVTYFDYGTVQVGERYSTSQGRAVLSATEYMDDGSPIQVTVNIDTKEGSAVIDFQ